MKLKKHEGNLKPLTEVELQLMNIIWEFGDCTVKDVQIGLSRDRYLAYTSVATIMKILEQKCFLKSQKSDKAHTFQVLVSKKDYESLSLRHLAVNLFNSNPTSMVSRLLDDTKISKKDLEAIQKVLKERLRS